jgi:hypothetical protein
VSHSDAILPGADHRLARSISMSDRRYSLLLSLLLVYPYQSTLNLLVGYSIKPLTYGVPFLLFLGVIFRRINTMPPGRRFTLPIEKYSLLNLVTALVFLPLSLAISFEGASMGFLVQYVGVFSFFVFKDLRINSKQKETIIFAMIASLFVSVVYGVYEYLFARFVLVDWLVAHSSHSTITGDIPLNETYKLMFYVGSVFYRSQSFELAFLAFGWQGFFLTTLLLGILFLWDSLRRKIWMALAMLLSFLGMVSSVTLSAVGMFVVGYFYFLLHLRGLRKIRIVFLSILMLGILILSIFLIPSVRQTVELGLEYNSAKNKLAAHEIDSNFDRADVLHNFIMGRGTASSSTLQRWFPEEMYVEHQYYSTIAERGIIGLIVYLLFMYSIYSHLRSMKRSLRYGTLDYAVVVSLIWVWVFYVVVGFIHNSWGYDIDFMFMGLVGLISNRNVIDRREEAFSGKHLSIVPIQTAKL